MPSDEERLNEGRKLAHFCMRKVFARHQDFTEVTLVLVHESAKKAHKHGIRQGAEPIGNGWAVLVGARSQLPPEPASKIPADRLPVAISAGQLHLLTSIGHDELISTKGGSG